MAKLTMALLAQKSRKDTSERSSQDLAESVLQVAATVQSLHLSENRNTASEPWSRDINSAHVDENEFRKQLADMAAALERAQEALAAKDAEIEMQRMKAEMERMKAEEASAAKDAEIEMQQMKAGEE